MDETPHENRPTYENPTYEHPPYEHHPTYENPVKSLYLNLGQIFEKCFHDNTQYVNTDIPNYWRNTAKYYHVIKYAKFRAMDKDDYSAFFSAQRVYHVLARFVQRCKAQKWYSRYNNDCDLTMTPLAELHSSKKIEIVENRCIYIFNLVDLVKIIFGALTIQSFGFIQPKMPTNPYTNMPFRLETLYSIYARLAPVKVPQLVWYFFDCQFSIETLKICHRKHLMKYAIDNQMSIDSVEVVREMCRGYFNIHRDFPPMRLYTIFRPYLLRYYRWTVLSFLRSKMEIDNALKSFAIYNPHFGTKGEGGFDDRHLSFVEFLNGPLTHNPTLYELAIENKTNYNSRFCVSLLPIFIPKMEEDSDDLDDEEQEEREYDDSDDSEVEYD